MDLSLLMFNTLSCNDNKNWQKARIRLSAALCKSICNSFRVTIMACSNIQRITVSVLPYCLVGFTKVLPDIVSLNHM